MTDDPEWDALFQSRPTAPGQPAGDSDAPPETRRDRRDRPRRRRVWPWLLLAFVLVIGAGAASVWTLFEPQVRAVLGWELSTDYEGDGNGEPVVIVIAEGEIGEDVARSLHEAGVTMTFDAFYRLLLSEGSPTFTPGAYALEKEMSAAAALAALSDPKNRVVAEVLVREGLTLRQIFTRLSGATGIPIAEYETAAADHASFGIPAEAPSLEGYLFPATYVFNPGTTAQQQLERMVAEMAARLDRLGIAEAERHRIVTSASLIQREARIAEDFYRVSRVIVNRLNIGMPLQFDSSSHYGFEWRTGTSSAGEGVSTTNEERADDNPYNTYVHTGLPIGPISAPSELALDAAMKPAQGDWLYFVTVNLETGQTVFTNNLRDHERAAADWRAWCRANPDSGC